ncbi:hypothetical protein KEM54_003930 [Ascosphaera aggregata]|nr:hypothetical protein KEM54_003930 [Ascosphaera aggregata]
MEAHKPPINLFKGYPSPSLHPIKALQEAASVVLNDPTISIPALSYGPDEGHGPLREAIAEWLTGFYGAPAKPVTGERIVITGGASQNLAATLNVFTDPTLTKAIWMISPTYYLACRIFDDAGFRGRLKAVPEDAGGIDLDELERGLAVVEARTEAEIEVQASIISATGTKSPRPWRKIFSHVIYGVPTFANPSGKIMTLEHRERLVRIARKYNALIITDDVYDLLCWPAASRYSQKVVSKGVPRLVDVDRYLDGGPQDEFGNSLSNGSFSKIIAPGLRVGYCEAMPKLAWGVSQAGSSRSGGAPSQWTSTLVCHLLTSGWLLEHIEDTLRPAYQRRATKLIDGIRNHLVPIGVHFTLPWQHDNNPKEGQLMGGYFVWLRLPDELQISAGQLADLAEKEENLLFTPGNACVVDQASEGERLSKTPGQDAERYLRLCFAYEEENLLEVGPQRLAELISREIRKQREN